MKFPYSMLLDFVDTALTAEQVGDLLTMAGFELEGIEPGDDPVLDIKVMSNRGDGLSVFGLAREVLAKDAISKPKPLYEAAAGRFADVAGTETPALPSDTAEIQAEACNRFACREFQDVPSGQASPKWMQDRLALAGMRPISLLVDLTNYVMLELGQPLHAFDRDKLRGGRIVVRHAQPGERLTTLNGEEHELAGQMMICDAERPVGVPGVMGGLETEVSDSTGTVLLESANFTNNTVRKTRKQLGLATEASYRFERSVDPDGVVAAIRRFSQLLTDAAPGVRMSTIVDHYPRPPRREPIRLRACRTSKLLGMEIDAEESAGHLRRLGMDVTITSEGVLSVVPPSWRPDIEREEDLVEEVGRVHGYDRIPEHLPQGTTGVGGAQGFELWTDWLREAAVRAGLVQTISHSLRDVHPLDEAGPRVGPRNPASPDSAWLRNSLLPSLADAARRNQGRDVRLFEIGRTFSPGSERSSLAVLVTGGADFFALKGVVEAVLRAGAVSCTYQAADDARLHPTRQAQAVAGGTAVAALGQIHPDVAGACGLPEDTMLAEVLLQDAFAARNRSLDVKPISRFPSVRRDISVLIGRGVPYERIEKAVEDAAGEVLERQWLFDQYAGKGIPEGSHSLAIALQLRKPDGTFTDEEANLVRDRAVQALEALGATRR